MGEASELRRNRKQEINKTVWSHVLFALKSTDYAVPIQWKAV